MGMSFRVAEIKTKRRSYTTCVITKLEDFFPDSSVDANL